MEDKNDVKLKTKYPYYKKKYIAYTFGACIFSIVLLYSSLNNLDDARIWVIIPIGLYGIYYVARNIKTILNKEEIIVENNKFIVKNNGNLKSSTDIEDILVHTHELIWKWSYDARKKLFVKDIKKPFYFYETKYLKKEDDKILSSLMTKEITNVRN